MSWEIIISSQIDNLRIWHAQLRSSRVLWVLWIVVAYFIFRKQVKLSKWQEDISKKQIELLSYIHNVETARHSIDILASNMNTNLLQLLNANICKYLDKNPKDVEEFTRWAKSLDGWFKVLNETIDKAIDNYTEERSKLPHWASWKYKEEKK